MNDSDTLEESTLKENVISFLKNNPALGGLKIYPMLLGNGAIVIGAITEDQKAFTDWDSALSYAADQIIANNIARLHNERLEITRQYQREEDEFEREVNDIMTIIKDSATNYEEALIAMKYRLMVVNKSSGNSALSPRYEKIFLEVEKRIGDIFHND